MNTKSNNKSSFSDALKTYSVDRQRHELLHRTYVFSQIDPIQAGTEKLGIWGKVRGSRGILGRGTLARLLVNNLPNRSKPWQRRILAEQKEKAKQVKEKWKQTRESLACSILFYLFLVPRLCRRFVLLRLVECRILSFQFPLNFWFWSLWSRNHQKQLFSLKSFVLPTVSDRQNIHFWLKPPTDRAKRNTENIYL